jgi:cytochrome c
MSEPGKRSQASIIALGASVAVLALAALSLIHPWGNLRIGPYAGEVLAGASVPPEVRTILMHKCGDCHSSNTRWPLYSRVAPSSWLVERDVKDGREHMNFSSWEQYNVDSQIDLLAKIASQLRQGKMPLKRYLLLHPDAKVSERERKLIADWAKSERKRLAATVESNAAKAQSGNEK